MFRDKKEELCRLEEELLIEAQREEADAKREAELEEAEALLDDSCDYGEESEQTYYNYSNQYGKVRAYNADRTDGDMDAYSNAVYEGQKDRAILRLVVLAACLLTAIVAVLGWCVLRYKGLL